jgi:hypothetical protein
MNGKERTYKEGFLRFGATGEFPKGYPHPGCFAKRGCKLLKTKDGSRKSKGKRLEAIETARVRVRVARGVS